MTRIGYARVSTEEQTTAGQLDELTAAGCTKLFTEQASGADRARPELARAIAACRAGDVLVVVRLDRLARSVRHLLEVIEQLREQGAGFRSLADPIDTTTPQGVFALQVLGAVAELERQLIAARTRAGIKAAVARGARPGNPGVRARDPDAIAKITQARAARHAAEIVASADAWLPTVRRLRPQHDWHAVVKTLNEGGAKWTVQRLQRSVRLLLAERLAEPTLLGRAPRKPRNIVALKAALAMRITNPKITLRAIGEQLQAMQIPSPRGHLRWSASMVAQLLQTPTLGVSIAVAARD
jgi:DNA invertase Pin-like site-specific DNA recombinase